MTAAPPRDVVVTGSSRLRSLDGLRGIAAAIVVIHHAGLLNPGISAVYLEGATPTPGSFAALIVRTPLQLLFSGQEAVLIFFVLSGLVVAIPPIDRPGFSWIGYYPRRVVRLLVPVMGSVILAIVIVGFTLRDPSTAVSGWAAASTFSHLDWRSLLADFDLLLGGSAINNPLWSLRQELLFSLMLPLYVVVAVVLRNLWWMVVVAAALVVLLGQLIGDPFWMYLPVFLLGTLAAVRRHDLVALADQMSRRRRHLLGVGLLLVGVVMLEMRWITAAVHPGSPNLQAVASAVVPFGATILVVLALVWAPLSRALEVKVVAWLGRISFSLYLVHVPILVATSALLRGLPWYAAPLVGIPVAVGVAVLFDRFVERPSHLLSQRVGRAVDARFLPATPAPTRPAS